MALLESGATLFVRKRLKRYFFLLFLAQGTCESHQVALMIKGIIPIMENQAMIFFMSLRN